MAFNIDISCFFEKWAHFSLNLAQLGYSQICRSFFSFWKSLSIFTLLYLMVLWPSFNLIESPSTAAVQYWRSLGCDIWNRLLHYRQVNATFVFWLCKSTTILLPTRYVLIINNIFQMRYCMKFYLKGHQNYNESNSKYQKRPTLLSEIG